ncbi:MAG TPA: hypothetical protein VKI61_15995 [Chitinophagaceae bacterium]|nr:hypothetical protein [Chitinophagaceae bacterium]
MNITRNNYEEFFMLYADNELTAAQRKEVEAFIAANIDLQQELALFQQFKLKPDAEVFFDNKASLLKQVTDQFITITNYESFFVLYVDDELTNSQKATVEDFVYRYPQFQSAFELLQQVKLNPDNNIVFENKELLLLKEEDDKVIPFYWLRMAAAAAVILFVAGLLWLNYGKKIETSSIAAGGQKAKPADKKTIQKDTAINLPDKIVQPEKEQIAATNTVKGKQSVKNTQPAPDVAVIPTKENKRTINNLPVVHDQNPVQKEDVAVKNNDEIKNKDASVSNNAVAVIETPKKIDLNEKLAAAAVNSTPDQPTVFLDPDKIENTKASFASLNSSNDNVEVLNTSVNTKNSLRGFLRKATRLIAKKTGSGNEDSKNKSILIGGFEIAVR